MAEEGCHFTSLEGFELVRVLALLKDSNTAVLQCRYREADAVVLVSHRQWTDETVEGLVRAGGGVELKLQTHNAEYYDFHAEALSTGLKVAVQWPARQWHIDKWLPAPVRLVRETPAMYAAATRPYVEAIPAAKNAWIENIFAGTKEADRILFMDESIVLAPDLKMDLTDPSSLYLQCILRDSSIRSVRDLRAAHLPVLRAARGKIFQVAREKLKCQPSELRIFMHYFPTFWWAHIHVQHVTFPLLGGSSCVGKAILLEDIMCNLELKDDYYASATLVTALKEGTPHHQAFVDAGIDLDEI